jgi:hypothetical protein
MIKSWDHAKFSKDTTKKALDGIEELARGVILTQCKEECPVDQGTMRGSLGVERDDEKKCIYLGGGGLSQAYIYRQHQDRSLNHRVGKAGFIIDPVEEHSPEMPKYIEKHIKG